jgi:tight adherence protein C
MIDRIETRIAAAGLLGKWSVEQVLAAKLLLALAAAVLGVLRVVASPDALGILTTAILPVMGWMAPDVVVGRRAEERKNRLRRELPDVLDQITIAVEAGLGFESALARVSGNGEGVVADELARTLQDIQLGVPRSDALQGLADRTDVPELRHLVGAIRQAERYGLRIAKVLRINAGELREKRRQAAEEEAQKLPVKILFPLIFFILPALFVVILGPAVVRVAHGGLGG